MKHRFFLRNKKIVEKKKRAFIIITLEKKRKKINTRSVGYETCVCVYPIWNYLFIALHFWEVHSTLFDIEFDNQINCCDNLLRIIRLARSS